jgi:hypothetical protein
MSSSLPDLQKERGFPHPSKKKKLLKSKRESTGWFICFRQSSWPFGSADSWRSFLYGTRAGGGFP